MKKILINAIRFDNGHILLSKCNGLYYVLTDYDITIYSENEMKEVYNFTLKEDLNANT